MHHTNEQDVVNAKSRIAELKSAYMTSLNNYISHSQQPNNNGFSGILDCQKKGAEYFNYVEEFVGNSDLLGAHSSSLWAQGFAEDCAEILKSMPQHFEFLQNSFSKTSANLDNHILPTGTAYANMQRMVVKYLDQSNVEEIKKLFIKSRLPVYGFNNQAKEFIGHMKKSTQIIIAFCFGVVFISVMLILSVAIPYPTDFQLFTFRVTLALAAGGIAAMLPGFMSVEISNYVRAGGALAAFVTVYFLNPPAMTVQNRQISGADVFVNKTKEDGKLAEYYWSQADLKFRFPSAGWQISTKAAQTGLGDMALQHSSDKNAQIQLHVSQLDDKYRDKWSLFKQNTESIWTNTINQFGDVKSEDIYVDGRSSFHISGFIRGQEEGLKRVDLIYSPLGDNRLFEAHLTRNVEHPQEPQLSDALKLILSTIHYGRL